MALPNGTVTMAGKRLSNGHPVADSAGQSSAQVPGPEGGIVANHVRQYPSPAPDWSLGVPRVPEQTS